MIQLKQVNEESSILCEVLSIFSNIKITKVSCNRRFYVVKVYDGYSRDYLKAIQMIHVKRQQSQQSKNNLGDKIQTFFNGTYLVIKYPFLTHSPILVQSLESIHDNRREILTQFIEKIFRAQPFYFYSYQNTFYNQFISQVDFNPISTAGLLSIIFKKSFSKREFKQIFELLDKKMFEETENRWNLVTYHSKIRAIAMLSLHLILGKRVTLLKENDIVTDEVSFQDVIRLLQKIPERFRKLLKGKDILETIKKAQQRDKANYLLFFRRVFEDNCRDLQWKQVLSLLFSKFKPKTDKWLSRCLKGIAQSVFKHEEEYVKEKLVLLGIAKTVKYPSAQKQKNTIGFQLKDYDLFLRILFQAASFSFQSVADQISQQMYYKTDNSSIFFRLAKIINEMAAREQINNEDLQPLNQYVNNSVDIIIKPTCTITKPLKSFSISKESSGIYNYTIQTDQTKIQDHFFEEPSEMQQQSKKNKFSEVIPQEHIYVIDKMAKLFKTNIAEVNSSKIKSIDRNMKIVGVYRRL